MLFLPLASFSVCHAICECLSSTEFRILLNRSWMYSCSFLRLLGISLWTLKKKFCALRFFLFLLLRKNTFFTLSRIFLTVIDSYVSLYLIPRSVGMHSTPAFVDAVTKFLYSTFGLYLSYVFWRLSNLFLTVNVYWFLISLLVNEDQS